MSKSIFEYSVNVLKELQLGRYDGCEEDWRYNNVVRQGLSFVAVSTVLGLCVPVAMPLRGAVSNKG